MSRTGMLEVEASERVNVAGQSNHPVLFFPTDSESFPVAVIKTRRRIKLLLCVSSTEFTILLIRLIEDISHFLDCAFYFIFILSNSEARRNKFICFHPLMTAELTQSTRNNTHARAHTRAHTHKAKAHDGQQQQSCAALLSPVISRQQC